MVIDLAYKLLSNFRVNSREQTFSDPATRSIVSVALAAQVLTMPYKEEQRYKSNN